MINSPHNLQHAVLLSTGRWLYIKTRCTFFVAFLTTSFPAFGCESRSVTDIHSHAHRARRVLQDFAFEHFNISEDSHLQVLVVACQVGHLSPGSWLQGYPAHDWIKIESVPG